MVYNIIPLGPQFPCRDQDQLGDARQQQVLWNYCAAMAMNNRLMKLIKEDKILYFLFDIQDVAEASP